MIAIVVLFLLMISVTTNAETTQKQLFIEDLGNNNGYIAIRLENVRLIDNYFKILHIVNITEFQKTIDNIGININIIKNNHFNNPIFGTIYHNYLQTKRKIENLRPHSHIRSKRGLVNFAGNALKFLTGTMDNNDEIEIRETLETLKLNNRNLISENNKQIKINKGFIEQINNISMYIQNQQNGIEKQLNKYVLNFEDKRFNNLENEIAFMENIYQIHYDLNLLRNHVDDIEQVILSSKLGVLTKNILNDDDLKHINDLNTLINVKTIVIAFENNIIITIMIPKYSEKMFYKNIIEPIPNKENMSIVLKENQFLTDENNIAYEIYIRDNFIKNIIKLNDQCITNIIQFKNANCEMKYSDKKEIKEILTGIIIAKNVEKTEINQNCNNLNITIEGNNLIRHFNCKIIIKEQIFDNVAKNLYKNIFVHNPKIIINNTHEHEERKDFKLDKFELHQIENRNELKEITTNNQKQNI